MSFFINKRLGIAFESTEGGLAKWNPESASFDLLMTLSELNSLRPRDGCRQCSEDEADAYMRAKEAHPVPETREPGTV